MASVPGRINKRKRKSAACIRKDSGWSFIKKCISALKSGIPAGSVRISKGGRGILEGPEGRPQLEIMHCANFLQPYYKDHSVYVVGMASGKADAIQMVNMITQEAFDRTGQWEAALYLAERTGWAPVSEELPVY